MANQASARSGFSASERAKFALLAEGVSIEASAMDYIAQHHPGGPLTPADYASTSGLILALPDDVWVNAPICQHNPNFVTTPAARLKAGGQGLVLEVDQAQLPVGLWVPPAYHGRRNEAGELYNSYAFSHGDRVRIAPIEGCSMTCKFCNLPYEFRYRTKRIEGLVDAVRVALEDPVQPASHVLISGGTPKGADVGYVRDCYEAVASTFPSTPVDIMMVPIPDLMDVSWLASIGISEVSVNIEVSDREIGRELMRQKNSQGLDTYFDYLEEAAATFGRERVRSMLMVGLEPTESTLRGVEEIARRGATPVLSPFRPDPATPLRDREPLDAANLEETFVRAAAIAESLGAALGPSCIPCSHNTLTLASRPGGLGSAHRHHGRPSLI